MQVAVFNAKSYDRRFLTPACIDNGLEPIFFEARLCAESVQMASGFEAVCVFVNDELNTEVVRKLGELGCKLIALRCAGFNNVDLTQAKELGIQVIRVAEYSPQAVAEHTFGLILALNRRIHKAYNRVREGNFSLENLLGFDLCKATIGVLGTGRIGSCVAQIANGFGARILLYDPNPNPELADIGQYQSLESIWASSDIVTLHCPLNQQTHHLVSNAAIEAMRQGVMLINTSRGGLIDTQAVIQGLKTRKIGSLGLDVYEEEAELFFEDRSETILQDDIFTRLLTFPNVLITSHQAFFTQQALEEIARTTAANIRRWSQGDAIPDDNRCELSH